MLSIRGGKWASVFGPTQMCRVPVVRPPRPSSTVTVSGQSAQLAPVGAATGTKRAVAEVALVQFPEQAAAHLYERVSPSLSHVVATTVVVSPTPTREGEAVIFVTAGEVLKWMSTEALPGSVWTRMAKLTEAEEPFGSVTVKVRVTGPGVAGAVHVDFSKEDEEKLPAEAVQA